MGKGKATDELVLSPGGRVKERRFKGYDSYDSHKGDKNDPDNRKKQRKSTTLIGALIDLKNDISWVCKHYPSFKYLKNMAEDETGNKVAIVDILRQNSEGSNLYQSSEESEGTKQALFNYHIDSKEDRRSIRVSVIFLLTHTQSSMQMGPDDHPHEVYEYKNCGNGVIFNSKFRHQSVYAQEGTIKISFFLTGKAPNQNQKNYVSNRCDIYEIDSNDECTSLIDKKEFFKASLKKIKLVKIK